MHLGGLLLQPPASPIAISNLTPAIFASTRCIHDIHAHTTRHPLHTLLRPISAPLNHVSFLRLTSRRRRRICLFLVYMHPFMLQPPLPGFIMYYFGRHLFGFWGLRLGFVVDSHPGSVHTVLLIFFFGLFVSSSYSIHAAFLHMVWLSRSYMYHYRLPSLRSRVTYVTARVCIRNRV
ncbi:hypothetical protein PISMIDRAFT_140755 [Pisolithus microcarpus 441]|uniref:Uncharacterized protein n=1 Tax=Pisolithus microcarpus 441 TaxID=765257 RepID=A0A0C9ZPU0_9AGAM|nr:hypothetical protein PISMIDRAFT_140634 [Pisolithus microcarpus 441]KIK31335.1 hypothetical protein PISMIDRAFT_140755 [Pisolithus microcarpus 441]